MNAFREGGPGPGPEDNSINEIGRVDGNEAIPVLEKEREDILNQDDLRDLQENVRVATSEAGTLTPQEKQQIKVNIDRLSKDIRDRSDADSQAVRQVDELLEKMAEIEFFGEQLGQDQEVDEMKKAA